MEVLQDHQTKAPTGIGDTIRNTIEQIDVVPKPSPFIESNTQESTLSDIKDNHIIPVFVKDNEPVISHSEFIEAAMSAVKYCLPNDAILKPSIRLSHPIKGRVPEAKNKPAMSLLDSEKTIYYERMAFILEIPSISTVVGGNKLNLTIGGVKAHNLDNLTGKSGTDQHFKVFIGFQNKVCTNLCISTDGYQTSLRVRSLDMLYSAIKAMVQDFDAVRTANTFTQMLDYTLSLHQFAQLIGKLRIYRHLPEQLRQSIPEISFGDSQINTVCREFVSISEFQAYHTATINLWQLYNLFTGANKSSYIDSFLDRGVNAYQLTKELQTALQTGADCWYLK